MNVYDGPECLELALAHAYGGGQSLLLSGDLLYGTLFDRDLARLVETARRLGEREDLVQCMGLASQHIILVGRPFTRALSECAEPVDWARLGLGGGR